jgi:hypothetical protein
MKLIKARDKWLLTKDILSGTSLYFTLGIQTTNAAGNVHFTTSVALAAATDYVCYSILYSATNVAALLLHIWFNVSPVCHCSPA